MTTKYVKKIDQNKKIDGLMMYKLVYGPNMYLENGGDRPFGIVCHPDDATMAFEEIFDRGDDAFVFDFVREPDKKYDEMMAEYKKV